MNNKTKLITAIVILILIIGGIWYYKQQKPTPMPTGEPVKIGVITPMTGDVAYWGESTAVGAKLAQADLKEMGIETEVTIEDGQLDPKVALSAAQKLIGVDKVDALYTEFNSPAIAVSSYLKETPKLYLFSAAAASPLNDGVHVFKTYLDYQNSCRDVAQYLKSTKNLKKIGLLKINLEYGDLCLDGIKEVYGNEVVVETYNAGDIDFRSSLAKLKAQNVDTIFNVSYQPETLASLKQMKELGLKTTFVGLSETITTDIIPQYQNILPGVVMFGLPQVTGNLKARADSANNNKAVADYNAVALAYVHIKQLAMAVHSCNKDLACEEKNLANAKSESDAGFLGFENRVGQFATQIQEWKDGKLTPIK